MIDVVWCILLGAIIGAIMGYRDLRATKRANRR
jgi:hypothetical protein